MASIPDFLTEMFEETEDQYTVLRQQEFQTFCTAHGVDPSNQANQRSFFEIHFLHDLLTTRNASDCARGGFLRDPYFWHWIEPNPRHSIFALPDSVPLTSVRASTPYGRYATFADIDRVPALYLADLVAEEPGYFHPDCGSFFTFGWCSEREMAYTAVMTAWGYGSKVFQAGIHTCSMVWCEFTGVDGTPVLLAAEVDNTFDSVRWAEIPESTGMDQWLAEAGSGAQVDWYNDTARAPGQLEILAGYPVGNAARARIKSMVESGMSVER